jgi:heptosyltransferase-2
MNPDITEAVRILVLTKFRYLGDTIVATPFLKQLRALAPGAEITLLSGTQIPVLLQGCPYVDRYLTVDSHERKTRRLIGDLRAQRFDAAFLLNRSLHSAYVAFAARIPHRIGFNTESRGPLLTVRVPYSRTRPEIDCCLDQLRAIGAAAEYALPELWITREERLKARHLLNPGDGCRLILVQPGAKDAYKKQWSAEGFGRVIQELAAALPGSQFALIGAEEESPACRQVAEKAAISLLNLAGRTGLREVLALIAESDLLIANDTAMVHAAAALRTSTVTVQGPQTSGKWSYGPPCHRVITTGDSGESADRHANRRALDRVRPEPVIEAALDLLNQKGT